jgi:molecular chaperone GrpE
MTKHKHHHDDKPAEPTAPGVSPADAAPAPEAQPAAPETARAEPDAVETLTAEREDLLNRLARLGADYQNYQKRIQRDLNVAREYANEGLIKDILAVLDDVERAIQAAEKDHPPDDPLLAGVRLVYDKALTVLGRHGLKRIVAVGQPFDPARHEALMQQVSDQFDVPTVLQQILSGYELKERVLRPAKVIVSKPPEEEQA